MDAMDWPLLARGALWVFGLALSLAAFSHARWTAKRDGVALRKALSWDAFLAPFCAGLTLFAISLAWGAAALWERLVWLALALLFAAQVVLALRGMRSGAAAERQDAERRVEGEEQHT